MVDITNLHKKAFNNLLKASKVNQHGQKYLETRWGKRVYRWFFTHQDLSTIFLEDVMDIDASKKTQYLKQIGDSKDVLKFIGDTEELYQLIKNLIYLPDNKFVKPNKRNSVDWRDYKGKRYDVWVLDPEKAALQYKEPVKNKYYTPIKWPHPQNSEEMRYTDPDTIVDLYYSNKKAKYRRNCHVSNEELDILEEKMRNWGGYYKHSDLSLQEYANGSFENMVCACGKKGTDF